MLVMLVSTLVMSGCGIEKKSGDEGNYDGELVYDHSMELQYAKLFSVDYYKGGYKLITITNRDEDTAIVSKQSKLLLVPDGSAHTILLLGQGDIFNEVTFFHNDTSYAATQAVSDTTLVKIPTDVFRAILKAHPALYGDISQLLSYKLRITMAHIYDLSFESVEHRLQNLLRRLCAQMGEPTADGVRIPYVFTHEDLAQMISAGRSNVSRCMNRFYSRDWVRFEGRCIVLRDGAFSAE